MLFMESPHAALLRPDSHMAHAAAVARRVAFHCPPHPGHSQSRPLLSASFVTAAGRCYGITREGQDSGKRCPFNVSRSWTMRCSLVDSGGMTPNRTVEGAQPVTGARVDESYGDEGNASVRVNGFGATAPWLVSGLAMRLRAKPAS